MVAGNGAAGFYLTKEQRPIEPAEAAAVPSSESGRCVPASPCCPLSISNPAVGGAWSGYLLFCPHPTWHTCSRALQKAYMHAHTHTVMRIKPRNFTHTRTTFQWLTRDLPGFAPPVSPGNQLESPAPVQFKPLECADSARWPVPPTTDQTFPYLTSLPSHSFMTTRGDDLLAPLRIFYLYLIASPFLKGNTSLRYAKPLFTEYGRYRKEDKHPNICPFNFSFAVYENKYKNNFVIWICLCISVWSQ